MQNSQHFYLAGEQDMLWPSAWDSSLQGLGLPEDLLNAWTLFDVYLEQSHSLRLQDPTANSLAGSLLSRRNAETSKSLLTIATAILD